MPQEFPKELSAREIVSMFESSDLVVILHGLPDREARVMTKNERKTITNALNFYAHEHEGSP